MARLVTILLVLFAAHAQAADLPNIIVVLTDDQRSDTVDRTTMPNTIRYLRRPGTTYPQAFVPTAVCCPSRASFLSGNEAHVHQVKWQDGAQFVGPDADTLATRLHEMGYRTGIFGKYLNNYHLQGPPHQEQWYVPPGWDVWNVLPKNDETYYDYDLVTGPTTVTHYGWAPEDYSTDVIAMRAMAFVRQAIADGVPFFAYVTPFAPHQNSGIFETSLPIAAPRHVGRLDDLGPYRPPSYAEPDNADKPTPVRVVGVVPPETLAWIDNFRRTQLTTLLAVDDLIGMLFRAVRQGRVAKDTAIVVTSDNGHLWYEHRLFGKNVPYEESHRVPLAIRYPRGLARRTVDSRLVTLPDVTATLLHWATGTAPVGISGRSFAVAQYEVRDAVPLESWGEGEVFRYRGVRTEAWKYVEWTTGEEELYDLIADPYELENVAADVALDAIKSTLRAQMLELGAGS